MTGLKRRSALFGSPRPGNVAEKKLWASKVEKWGQKIFLCNVAQCDFTLSSDLAGSSNVGLDESLVRLPARFSTIFEELVGSMGKLGREKLFYTQT